MRARFIYERFSEEGDPIADMGIGQRALIRKWFETWAPKARYTIDDDLNISVGENLNLRGTQITKLPDNLSVGGNLYLRGTPIAELPKILKVKGKIFKDF